MSAPGEIEVLFEVWLTEVDVPTGRVRHYRGGLLPKPSVLRIAHFPDGGGGYYILYLDADCNEQTDTFHETIEAAMEYATFEFGLPADRWRELR